GQTTGAVHLDGHVDNFGAELRHHDFRHRNQVFCILVADAIHFVRGAQCDQAAHFNFRSHHRDRFAHRTLLAQLLAEGDTIFHAFARIFQRALRSADDAHAMVDAAWAETALRDLETATFAEQDIRLRHAAIVENDFGVTVRLFPVTHCRQRAFDDHARRAARHQYL